MGSAMIPLSFRTPQIETSLDAERKALSLAALGQTTQMNALRMKQAEAQNKALEQQQRDVQTIQQEFANPAHRKDDGTLDWDKFRGSIASKVAYPTLNKLDQDHLEQQRAFAAKSAAEKAALQSTNQLIGQEVAGLLSLPQEQRMSAAQQAVARLQKAGVDMTGFTLAPDHLTDDWLNQMAARTGYQGNIISWDQKKAKAEADRQAAQVKKQEEDEKQKQRLREQAARDYYGVSTDEEHQKWQSSLPKDIAGEYANLSTYAPENQRLLDNKAMTAKDRQANEQREESRRETADWRQQSLDLRRDIANQNDALRRYIADQGANHGGSNRPLTQGQIKVEERAINNIEYGTATHPGLHTQRLQIGQQIKSGVDSKGNTFKDANGNITNKAVFDELTNRLKGINDNLQSQQFRKAKLYGIEAPDPAEIADSPDGEEIEAADGSVWKKSGGVAFFSRMGGGDEPKKKAATAPETPPATQPTPQRPAGGVPGAAAPKTKQLVNPYR